MRFSRLIALIFLLVSPLAQSQAADLTAAERQQIANEAYLYLYPLVTMEVTRLQMTNVEPGREIGRGPMNMFQHMPAYPTADFRGVVRPNFDTLYSSAWLDVSTEPVLIKMPDTKGRYYLLPALDMWTDVLGAPGTRTSGNKAQTIAVLPPGWKGRLPKNVLSIQSTTPYLWMIGRIQTNGEKDYPAVHALQKQMSISPLSSSGKGPFVPKVKIDPGIDMKTSPLDQVNSMTGEQFFDLGMKLMKQNPPHVTDWSQLERLRRLGLVPGGKYSALNADSRQALDRAPQQALGTMKSQLPRLGRVVNGWSVATESMGVYGDNYLRRALIAMGGLGANQPEDAIYPISLVDEDQHPLVGEKKYFLHFKAGQTPPVDAFWSLTLYDAQGFQVANDLNRFALGSAAPLKLNADGSLDIYIQHDNPGPEKVDNWLPSPESGAINLTLRLYAPQASVLDGRWVPPPILLR